MKRGEFIELNSSSIFIFSVYLLKEKLVFDVYIKLTYKNGKYLHKEGSILTSTEWIVIRGTKQHKKKNLQKMELNKVSVKNSITSFVLFSRVVYHGVI